MPIPNTHIHLIANHHTIGEKQEVIAAITKGALRAKGFVSQKWLNDAVKKPSSVQLTTDHLQAIKRADLVIAEATDGDLDVGLLTYLAAQYRKQVLILVESNSQASRQFISGISSKYIDVREYSSIEQIMKIVRSFVASEAIPDRDLRFNMFINHRIYRFLRQRAFETGKNRSAIIRELLEKKLDDSQK